MMRYRGLVARDFGGCVRRVFVDGEEMRRCRRGLWRGLGSLLEAGMVWCGVEIWWV